MQAYIRLFGGEDRAIPLAEALTPQPYVDYGAGAVETAQAQADENAKAIGALAAILVEQGATSIAAIQKAYSVGDSVYFEE